MKEQFICLGENTKKYITFTVPIKKEVTKLTKNGQKVSYILQFTDSARCIESLLSIFYSFEGIHKIKCKCEHDDKKCETCVNYCNCFFLIQKL